MSRARPIRLPNGEEHWFDTSRNGERATAEQVELLVSVIAEHSVVYEDDLDDLLDEVLTQGEVIKKLRAALGEDPIPADVLERRRKWREQRSVQPCCRVCGKEGDSTKHHFVNKWILRELRSYQQKWAERSKNCLPVCIDCHRKLHSRENGSHSIAECLTDEEKSFAEAALSALAEERPKLLILIARGDDSVYEARLVKDWIEGRFRIEDEPSVGSHAAHLRVVA